MAHSMFCFLSMSWFFHAPSHLFFSDTPTTEIYTLSLHDALPISPPSLTRFPHKGDYRRVTWCFCLASSRPPPAPADRKSTRLNSSHLGISYAVFCLKKKKTKQRSTRRWTLTVATGDATRSHACQS